MSLMRIDDLFHFEKGILQSSKCTEGEFDFITASSEWKTHNEYTHDCEALVFAAAASGSLGRTHYVNGKFISSDLCFIITAKDPIKLPIDLKFYHMIFNEFKNDIVNSTKAGTSKEAIGMKAFGNYKLPYFAINKQINTKVQFVNMQDSKVELNVELTHQLDLIKQLRQAFLREAMQGNLIKSTNTKETGKQLLTKIKAEKAQLIKEKKLKKEKELAPISEDEIPFDIPEHWAWCRFEDICEIKSNLVNPDNFLKLPHIAPNHIEKGTGKLLEYQTVEEDELISAKHYFYPGQLLYSKVRPKLNKIVKVDFEGLCSADMYPLEPLINIDFLLNCMLSQFFLDEVDKFDNRVKMPKINQKQLSQLPIPLPPIHEQQQIVTQLEELMSFCDGLEQSIKESQGYNEMLLQQVLREALQGEEV